MKKKREELGSHFIINDTILENFKKCNEAEKLYFLRNLIQAGVKSQIDLTLQSFIEIAELAKKSEEA